MEHSSELAKVGIEAFKLMEESNLKPRKRHSHHHHHHQPKHPHTATELQVPSAREVIDCYQAAQKYGGVLVVDYRTKKLPLRQPY